jgi:hypothetical protein
MASKSISITFELAAFLDSLRSPGQSYDGVIRVLAKMPKNPLVAKQLIEHPDYTALKALQVGKSCLLAFERPVAQIPVGAGPNGELTADQQKVSHGDMTPTNLRHLAQVVRRVQEREGYKLFVEGRPRGQQVTRIA